jgi:hypothetical protein
VKAWLASSHGVASSPALSNWAGALSFIAKCSWKKSSGAPAVSPSPRLIRIIFSNALSVTHTPAHGPSIPAQVLPEVLPKIRGAA